MASPSLPEITPPIEDYLKAIYMVGREAEGRASTSAIAERMEVSAASATNMMQRLAEMKLVDYVPYKGVSLTPSGEKIALEVIRHHRLLELYLAQALGYSWDAVHDEAERLEHVISEEFEDRIDAMLGHPTIDPHGDPIPPKSGSLPAETLRPLSDVEAGERVIVRRVSDRDGELLRSLDALGLVPGTRLEVVDRGSEEKTLTLRRGHETGDEEASDTLSVDEDLARKVYVE